MRKLSETIARLAAMAEARQASPAAGEAGHLQTLSNFGTNPGALTAKTFIPEALPEGAALVVVLHGCTQTADGYDTGSGWSQLAARDGFALLFPEQRRANNPNLCFNWFAPGDARRGAGEALSIRQMIQSVVEAHKIDPRRIFITGLSAGGAMASVMLATYPELFAGGAIIAGLPYGSASNAPQAFDRMRGHGGPTEQELVALVRAASSHTGPWPTISVWHGSGDATVNPGNAADIIAQWRTLHGVAATPSREEVVEGYPRRIWTDSSGRDVIEEYSITGMGHGTPLATQGAPGFGKAGPFMLDVQISSTVYIARFWQLHDGARMDAPRPEEAPAPARATALARTAAETVNPRLRRMPGRPGPGPTAPATGVGKVIEDALRAADLMR
ncbi:alpha/beta hydrolase family esterase [Sphingomonas sp.]|uniref:extracellular catalytic domain type 1 short-chain-length polyhydroxyalkanoate depolymerase n=1 Tax=Sphingomonas sp. TaxID=28214 RepID=UPI003B3A93FB